MQRFPTSSALHYVPRKLDSGFRSSQKHLKIIPLSLPPLFLVSISLPTWPSPTLLTDSTPHSNPMHQLPVSHGPLSILLVLHMTPPITFCTLLCSLRLNPSIYLFNTFLFCLPPPTHTHSLSVLPFFYHELEILGSWAKERTTLLHVLVLVCIVMTHWLVGIYCTAFIPACQSNTYGSD